MGTKGDRLRRLLVLLAVLTAGLVFPAASLAEVRPLRIYLSQPDWEYGATTATVTAPRRWTIENASACTVRGRYGNYPSAEWRTAAPEQSRGHAVKFTFPAPQEPPAHMEFAFARCPDLKRVTYTTERVRTGWARHYKWRRGVDTSSLHLGSGCYSSRRGHRGWLYTSCWGNSARLRYGFRLPRGARRIRHDASGFLDFRGSSGRFDRDWSRSGRRHTYTVRLSGRIGYTMRWVEIRYKTPVMERVRHRHVDRASGYGEYPPTEP